MSSTPNPPRPEDDASAPHPSELETSVETMTAEVLAGFGMAPEPPEVPLDEVAQIEQLNDAAPLSDEELARQALEAPGDDGDAQTPE